MVERLTARRLRLGDGAVVDIPECCFQELLATAGTRTFATRAERYFQGDVVATNFDSEAFQMFCHWCHFLGRFNESSGQVQRFKQYFLPENCCPQFLLQLLQVASLFGVRTLQDFAARQLGQRMESMGVEEITRLFQAAKKYEDVEYQKFLQELYIDEVGHDFAREDSDA